jgi:hypothetical protein
VGASLALVNTVGSAQNTVCTLTTGDSSEAYLGGNGAAASRLPMGLLDVVTFNSPATITLHWQGFGVVINRANLVGITVSAIN